MNNTEIIDRLVSDEQRERDKIERRHARFLHYAIILIILILTVTWIWGLIYTARQPTIKWVKIENIKVIVDTAVCPGERLLWEYDLVGAGTGTLEIDGTSVKVNPPSTVVFSEAKRLVVSAEIAEKVIDSWQVPPTQIDPVTGEAIPFPPGQYIRRIAVSSPSRSSAIDVDEFLFSIREDCT